MKARFPDVQLLVLFGSRVKDYADDKSDWDVAIQTTLGTYKGFDQLVLQDEIAQLLNISSDKIDLVHLRYCSPLLAFTVAREGQLIYEDEPATFHRFQVRAAKVYADTAKLRRLQNRYVGLAPGFGETVKR